MATCTSAKTCSQKSVLSQKSVWPPEVGRIVLIKTNHHKEPFIGRVRSLISDNSGAICELLNNMDYVEKVLQVTFKEDGRGLFLLIPTYRWNYVTDDVATNLVIDKERAKEAEKAVKTGYDIFISNVPKSDRPRSEGLSDKVTVKDKGLDITGKLDKNLLTSKGEPDLNYLFTDDKYEYADEYGEGEERNPSLSTCQGLDQTKQEELKNILDEHRELSIGEIGIATSGLLSYENIINSERDQEGEGEKIINWIKKRINEEYKDYLQDITLNMFVHNGYVFAVRKGCKSTDEIREEMFKDELKYFEWQIGKPINYDTLKYIIFRNPEQKDLVQDRDQLEEAKKILSQEYLVALHPDPRYQMWCLKRLILCWYADDDLFKNIRKIKVLINQYRAVPDKEYNKLHGVLPSIVVYPMYGKKSVSKVMEKLGLYFFHYEQLGWVNSNPTYFTKKNDLMYYTNGLMDLKLYFRNVGSKSGINLVFSDKFTHINDFDDPFKVIETDVKETKN